MINVVEVYNDVALDDVFSEQNGNLNSERFNRMSWRATLKMIDWLTGDTKGGNPPPPLNQKNRDFLNPFIVPYTAQVNNGVLEQPVDYYTWDNGFLVTTDRTGCEEDDVEPEIVEVNLVMLTTDKFNIRSGTDIESLKPSIFKPIIRLGGVSKITGKASFVTLPKDLGTVQINYVRLPAKAQIISKVDPFLMDLVPDLPNCVNYDFPESARNVLEYFITQEFSMHTREKALFEVNQAVKP